MCEFADASREVDAADCEADGDPRELLQSQRARVEVVTALLQMAIFGLKLFGIALVIIETDVARYLEAITANGQIARVQLAASEAERQKLIRNANAAFRLSEDQHSNQPDLLKWIHLSINIIEIYLMTSP